MLIEIAGSERKPQHLPIGSLKVFGTNTYGEAIFRVVWSESRYYMVGAKHTDYDGDPSNDKTVQMRGKDPNAVRTQSEYRWLPLYPNQKCWILELWKTPFGFAGCTPEQWNERFLDPQSGLLTLGPYPSRGEYSQCFTFPSEPGVSVVHEVINRIRAGWNYTYHDHLNALNKAEDKKKADHFSKSKDIFLDSQQAFKNKPSNIRPGKRTPDKINLRYTADQVGIHKRGFSTQI